MKKLYRIKLLTVFMVIVLLAGTSGCAALKKKFTRKTKEKPKTPVFYQVRKYNIKPSMELYEKHYIFWINWQRKLIAELGKNFKNDIRCSQEIEGNVIDMVSLLVDDEAAKLTTHLEELSKIRAILEKRNMTKVNETRIRQILEREYRVIKREFSPGKMSDHIRKDWKKEEE